MRVLLVDDEEELVSTIAERLSYRGIDADWVTTAEEALERADLEDYDVAVLDVKMPRIGGLELKRLLEQKRPSMRFIFVTGHGSLDDFRAGVAEAGSVFYLAKPVGLEELVHKLREVLGMESEGEE
ncbi:MAG: response regulator [Planctomycetota bacterium]